MIRLAPLAVTLAALILATAPASSQESPLLVFAAASMKNALDEVNAAYAAQGARPVVASYAASSALARQIEQGAPADIFMSADTDWMDFAIRNRLVAAASRVDLLGNALLLIAPANSPLQPVEIGQGFDLAALAGDGRIAVGDIAAVPAGRYAKAALETLGAWTAAARKFAMADSVRAALTLVARGEAALGIVYATDAKVERGVKVIGTFPAGSHPPIVYPVAATAAAKPASASYLGFLRSASARAIFERFGFIVLARPAT